MTSNPWICYSMQAPKPDPKNREGVTPLHMASLYGNAKMVARLVKGGADARQLGPAGETMLMLAARNGNPEAVNAAGWCGRGRECERADPRYNGADVGRRTAASCRGGRINHR
jgi:hypothetical protein